MPVWALFCVIALLLLGFVAFRLYRTARAKESAKSAVPLEIPTGMSGKT